MDGASADDLRQQLRDSLGACEEAEQAWAEEQRTRLAERERRLLAERARLEAEAARAHSEELLLQQLEQVLAAVFVL